MAVEDAAEHYFSVYGRSEPEYGEGIPVITPPFRRLFIEAKATADKVYSAPMGKSLNEISPEVRRVDWGVFFESRDLYHETGALINPEPFIRLRNYDVGEPQEWMRWFVLGHLILELNGTPVPGVVARITALLGMNGNPVAFKVQGEAMPNQAVRTETLHDVFGDTQMAPGWFLTAELAQMLVRPLFFGISLAHCKNVQLVDTEPPPKLSKKNKRRTGKPLTTYKVLTIRPTTQRVDGSVSEPGKAEGTKRLYITRGTSGTLRPPWDRLGAP